MRSHIVEYAPPAVLYPSSPSTTSFQQLKIPWFRPLMWTCHAASSQIDGQKVLASTETSHQNVQHQRNCWCMMLVRCGGADLIHMHYHLNLSTTDMSQQIQCMLDPPLLPFLSLEKEISIYYFITQIKPCSFHEQVAFLYIIHE